MQGGKYIKLQIKKKSLNKTLLKAHKWKKDIRYFDVMYTS